MSTKFQVSESETMAENGKGVQVDSDNENQQQLGEAASLRGRQGSDPAQLEPGTAEEGRHPRGRSKSAPAVMWVAMHYGRELRRMSDEFDMAFQGHPHPKSAKDTSKLKKAGGWISSFKGIFAQSRRKEDLAKPKIF